MGKIAACLIACHNQIKTNRLPFRCSFGWVREAFMTLFLRYKHLVVCPWHEIAIPAF